MARESAASAVYCRKNLEHEGRCLQKSTPLGPTVAGSGVVVRRRSKRSEGSRLIWQRLRRGGSESSSVGSTLVSERTVTWGTLRDHYLAVHQPAYARCPTPSSPMRQALLRRSAPVETWWQCWRHLISRHLHRFETIQPASSNAGRVDSSSLQQLPLVVPQLWNSVKTLLHSYNPLGKGTAFSFTFYTVQSRLTALSAFSGM